MLGKRMTSDYMVLMSKGYKYPTMAQIKENFSKRINKLETVPQYRLQTATCLYEDGFGSNRR